MAPLKPPLTHGIREATGVERPPPGILCWNCRQLSPFPSGSCKWCGAAFAGTAGGVVPDHIPETTVRAPLSVPAVALPIRPKRRIIRHLVDPRTTAGSTPRETPVGRSSPSPSASGPRRTSRATSRIDLPQNQTMSVRVAAVAECPVCGRPPYPGARGCVCGAVFGDATTTFNCAECGSVMPIEADWCFVCGVPFHGAGAMTYACPLCGTSVDEAASVCRCGARFAD